jgi:hypothetical protein
MFIIIGDGCCSGGKKIKGKSLCEKNQCPRGNQTSIGKRQDKHTQPISARTDCQKTKQRKHMQSTQQFPTYLTVVQFVDIRKLVV